jgi:hypothetical protein
MLEVYGCGGWSMPVLSSTGEPPGIAQPRPPVGISTRSLSRIRHLPEIRQVTVRCLPKTHAHRPTLRRNSSTSARASRAQRRGLQEELLKRLPTRRRVLPIALGAVPGAPGSSTRALAAVSRMPADAPRALAARSGMSPVTQRAVAAGSRGVARSQGSLCAHPATRRGLQQALLPHFPGCRRLLQELLLHLPGNRGTISATTSGRAYLLLRALRPPAGR